MNEKSGVLGGVNSAQLRQINRRRTLNLLYRSPGLTNQEIAAALGLSLPTVTQVLRELSEHGLLSREKAGPSSGGRRPQLNVLRYDAKCAAGIEITRHHVSFALIDLACNVRFYRRLRRQFEPGDAYARGLSEDLAAFLGENGVERETLLGLGLALPGIMQGETLAYAPTLGVRGMPVEIVTRFLPLPAQTGNEANLAGYAEIWGIERLRDAVYLSVNKGVGGAILIGGAVYDGAGGRAGEFGHMTIVKNGRRCSCGKKGCFEAYCSTTRLTLAEFDDLDSFFATLRRGDACCEERFEAYLDDLATGINGIRAVLDADVILGGELGQQMEPYLGRLREKLGGKNSFGEAGDYLSVSRFGGKAACIGAALLPVDRFLSF